MKLIKLTALFVVIGFNNLLAQNIRLKESIKDDLNKINLCKPETKLLSTLNNEKVLLQSILQGVNELQFKLDRTVKDANTVHNHYIFLVNGIPVYGAGYVIHSSNGTIDFANGNIPVLGSSITFKPVINYDEAKKYLIKELSLKLKDVNKSTLSFIDNKLVLFWNNKELLLAYKIEVKTENVLLNGNYIVDAKNVNNLYFEPSVCAHNNAQPPPNAPGTAQTLYSSNQNFTTDAFNGQFRLREVSNGVNILTLNASNQSNVEVFVNNATDFIDNDNNWQAAEHGNDRYATDVHWATEYVIDYWHIVHSRNSINNQGMDVKSYVHAFNPSTLNAFWDPNYKVMLYCDGAGSFGPLGAFDVVAHEIGHGVCQYTAGLISGNAESGALNEGFSDIWGAAIEGWAAPGKQKWKIGEDIFSGCLRNLENPKDPTAYEGQHPNTYLQQYWSTSGEPHTNSTILSHWFYLVSEGGSGTNDLSNTYSVSGVGINTAAKIAYRTEQLLNSNANYAMARTISIQASQDLYGVNSCEEKAVTDAWYAVGVGAAFTGNVTYVPVITGNGVICGVNATQNYTVNLPVGATATWSANASVSITPITSNGSEVAVTNISAYGTTTYLTAVVNSLQTGGCNPVPGTYTANKQLTLGSPGQYSFTPYITQNGNTTYMSSYCNLITGTCGPNGLAGAKTGSANPNIISPYSYCASGYITDATASSITWSVYQTSAGTFHGYYLFNGNQFEVSINANYVNEWIVLKCTRSNTCGSASSFYKFYAVQPPNGNCGNPPPPCYPNCPEQLTEISKSKIGARVVLSPNPSSGQFSVSLIGGYKSAVIKEIIVTNKMGIKIYQQKFSNNENTKLVRLYDKPTDLYTVQVYDGKEWQTQKIIIQQ